MSLAVMIIANDWHVNGFSSAFVQLVVDPILEMRGVTLDFIAESETPVNPDLAKVYVFCQALPTNSMLNNTHVRVIWIPMWDDVRSRSQSWWNQLPKHLRILAFSRAVAEAARCAGLPVLDLQYFQNPADFVPASFASGKILYYWNRRGLVGPSFLIKFCEVLQIDRLLFRPTLDPGIDQRAYYELPNNIGSTTVEIISDGLSREEYWKAIEPANLVIAPRLHEGVGLVFLEAMARGCVVFANDAPTMNEYITHGENGFLFRRGWTLKRIAGALAWRIASHGIPMAVPFNFHIERLKDWKTLEFIDLESMGSQAKQFHAAGYEAWCQKKGEFYRFLFEGVPTVS
jgi:hypothetical protein